MMKVLALCNGKHALYEEFFEAIAERYKVVRHDPSRPAAEQFEGIDVVVDMGGWASTKEFIEAGAAAGVRLWQVATTGLDHVDVACFLEKGVPLAYSPGSASAVSLAEHAFFLLLCAAKGLKRNDVGKWARTPNEEISGKTLGIVGFGASGRELARRASAFGLRTMAIGRSNASAQVARECGVDFWGTPDDLYRVLSEADYVSLHLPLTDETRCIIDIHALNRMKPTAVLINIARGGLIDEAALLEALTSGRIRGAALDVFLHEPVDPGHPLLALENVVVTPHVAGFTAGVWRRRALAVTQNIERVNQGLEALDQVQAVP
jgi:phosphoglycerate dehydrogenase-like enzyme